MGQARLPVSGDLAGLRRDLVDVPGQGKRDHVGGDSVAHCPGLRARPAMRLLDLRGRVALRHPPVLEPGVVITIKFARGVVADVQQRLGLRLGRAAGQPTECDQRRCDDGFLAPDPRGFAWHGTTRNLAAPSLDQKAAIRQPLDQRPLSLDMGETKTVWIMA